MLKGKICFVSGASRGIGREIVKNFVANDAIVYANIRTLGALDTWIDELPSNMSVNIRPIVLDICDSQAVKDALLRIKREHGRIDVWVNNAAIAYNEAIGMISQEHVRQMFETNVLAVIENIQLVSRLMIRQKAGSIINISSIVGVKGDAGQMAYSATKGAVIALTKSAAKELAPYQIRVNSIAPGLTKTDLMQETAASFLEKRISNIGMGRVAEPKDIANACLFFASNLSEYVTGQILGVDGASII
ncbi:MAG: SDR family NAD(P)-dependent oxidoreductase [Enterocloster aldenensis]|uniref:SDR family NAD(P)-dependent oxidoreductase n=1 Tax=Enterocloster aldenensis TaxID=358742 RepID=UPI0025A3A563|nr:SDR family oxidoreductase [Enterocloster aldenensis]